MKISTIAITANGANIAKNLSDVLGKDHSCECFIYQKYADKADNTFDDLSELTAELFTRSDALIFVCACGIAVRMIAPHIVSKTTDPAVIAIDESGKFAVSLLSGHIGGANVLTRHIAKILGAIPVITTATDTGCRFSPDSFAAANGLHICEMEIAKEIAAAIVSGQKIGFSCDYPYVNMSEKYFGDRTDIGIRISGDAKRSPFARTLHLVPKDIIIGVGCKKNTPSDVLDFFICRELAKRNLSIHSVYEIHTIDIKKDEPAINAFCRKYKIPLRLYTAHELMSVPGEFARSEFVLHTTGADNICERAAAAEGGKILVSRQARDGMTFAAAVRDIIIDFDRRQL